MAFKKILPRQRIFSAYKFSAPSITTCRIASSTMVQANSAVRSSCPDKITTSDPCRFLHHSLAFLPEIRLLPTGEKLREKLRGLDIMRLNNGQLPLRAPPRLLESDVVSVAEARKDVWRLTQVEMLKSRLRKIEKSWILVSEFIEICKETCLDADQDLEFARELDESGDVIVLGNVVFLRPDQVVRAMQELMPMHLNHDTETMKELQQMEEQKTTIDKKAESLVRREMWLGLGCFVVQTTAFMRFTFWDLTWDVMEPICFYLTSTYFMAAYFFFLKTSKEPSFEGFFRARFTTKQKRLMKVRNFDLQRYNELLRAQHPHSPSVNR